MKPSAISTNSTSLVDRNIIMNKAVEEATKNAVPPQQTLQKDDDQKKEETRGKWTHNPFILSLIACSNMHDCEEVEEIFHQCQENNSSSMLCEAADKYHQICNRNGGKLLDECHYRDF
jgi:siroheme synthase (precorrin-2 oxidase/ferrochelatase)